MRLIVSCIPGDGGKSGISVYERAVVAELRRQGHELLVLEDAAHPILARRPVLSMMWHLFVLPLWLWRRRREWDGFVICAANRRASAWYPLPTVATVHDLANFHIPGKYSRLRMLYLAHVLPFFAKRAQRLVAISESTKADMVRFWGCAPEDVTVLYNGIDGAGGPAHGACETAPAGEATAGECDGSILYISRIEHPGKNHARLIEAYSRLPPEAAAAHPLILAGADWKDAEAVHAAAAASPNAAHIHFTGFVDDAALEKLWRAAGFYVFPSLFEGFGLSLATAMARGIPCACSSNGSLGEIAGDAAITFDPYDTDAIHAALLKLLTEPQQERAERISRGIERVKLFSWPRHAAGLVGELARSDVFGVHIDCDTNAAAVAAVRSLRGDAFAFVNAHCLNIAFRDEEYRRILATRFAKVWPDGVGVRMAGRRLGFAVPENVNGTDLFPLLAASGGLSFWFLGAAPGVAEEALRKCREKFPASRFLGATDGYRTDWTGELRRISSARPDVLLVALGVPMQEKWIDAHMDELGGIGSVLAVGGLLDFLSGRIPRAPKWVRRASLEWAWRLAMEPRRMFRRYVIGNWLFLHRVALEKKRRKSGRAGA